jgi:hypothetical protein
VKSPRAQKSGIFWYHGVSLSIPTILGGSVWPPAPNRGGTGILEAYSGGTRGPHRALRACYFTPVRKIVFRSTSGSFCLQSCLGAMRPGKSKGTRGGDAPYVVASGNTASNSTTMTWRWLFVVSQRTYSMRASNIPTLSTLSVQS